MCTMRSLQSCKRALMYFQRALSLLFQLVKIPSGGCGISHWGLSRTRLRRAIWREWFRWFQNRWTEVERLDQMPLQSFSVLIFMKFPQKLEFSSCSPQNRDEPDGPANTAIPPTEEGWVIWKPSRKAWLNCEPFISWRNKPQKAPFKHAHRKCWDYLFRICFKRAQAALIYFWENIWLTIVNYEFRCCALDQLLRVWEHLILYIAAIWTKLFF